MYEVRYLDGDLFDRFTSEEEAMMWAVMIDATFEKVEES